MASRNLLIATIFDNWRKGFIAIFLTVMYTLPLRSNGYLNLVSLTYNDTAVIGQTALDSIVREGIVLDLPGVRELEVELYCCPCEVNDTISYFLKGLDKAENFALHPHIRYTNLAKGRYTLMISSSSASETIELELEVGRINSDHLLEKWWFQPLLTFCLLLIPFTVAYFLSLDRSRRNLRLEVVRNQIAGDLHDDVGANLSAINNLTEMLKKRQSGQLPDKLLRIVDKIKRYTEETLANLQDTVWAINPLNDSVEELLEKMKGFAILMLQAKGIDLNFANSYDPMSIMSLDMQQRHSMFMMFKEVINNIVKHAEAGEVKVDVHNTRNTLVIQVKDDGIGFDAGQGYAGNGLKNFQARAKENFIDLDVASKMGEGTAIRMEIYSLG